MAIDPVCGMRTEIPLAAAKSVYEGRVIYFCSKGCKEAFDAFPGKFLEAKEGRGRDLPGRGLLSYGPVPYFVGVSAALAVVGFYLGLNTLTSGWYYAMGQLGEYRWWILALAVGLGVQATLYSILRRHVAGKAIKGAKSSLAASGGMSGASMAACCAHYLAVILPAIGLPFLSAAAAGLVQYQAYFFLAGVLSNVTGIVIMLRLMEKNGIIGPETYFGRMVSGLRRMTQ